MCGRDAQSRAATQVESSSTSRRTIRQNSVRVPVERAADNGVRAAAHPDVAAFDADDELRVVADFAPLADDIAAREWTRGFGMREIRGDQTIRCTGRRIFHDPDAGRERA